MFEVTSRFAVILSLFFGVSITARAETPRVLPESQLPQDKRLEPLVDLYKHYFQFTPPSTPEAWAERSEPLRRQTLVANGLWPMPTKTPANAVVHGRIDRGDYTVEKVYFESFPGHFVTGSLYRPKGNGSKRPGVLCPHGHWLEGRFYDCGPKDIRQKLIEGRERFEVSGRYPTQARCVQLARMGCVVFHYDMIGYADSVQLGHWSGVRDAMNTPENWGYFSPQAELRLQCTMGLQTYNSVRALDWLCSLPDVDPDRIGVTGASGGGTQTFLLSAIDRRVSVSFPAVMISTAMQGGCSCENASYLRCETGNIELAALIAPRPLGMTGADDWTKEIAIKGLPELQSIYKMLGAEDQVMAKALVHFPHNYNYVSRAVMYHWFNKHLELGLEEPIVEEDFQPLSKAENTVWDQQHPKPAAGDDYERSLLHWITEDSDQQIAALVPSDAAELAEYRKIVGGAWDVMIGRRVPEAGAVVAAKQKDTAQSNFTLSMFLLRYEAKGEEVPAAMLKPNAWNGRVVIWIDKQGKQSLFATDGAPRPAIGKLLTSGVAILGLDLFGQGEFTTDGQPLSKQRLQRLDEKPWSDFADQPEAKFAGFTFGYNYPLFSKRVHDILSAIAFARDIAPDSARVDLVGLHGAGHWVAAARAQAEALVERAVINARGFRFAAITAFDDPDFVPGAAKYLDMPGLLALSAPGQLWLADEGAELSIVRRAYHASCSPDQLTTVSDAVSDSEMAAVEWLLP